MAANDFDEDRLVSRILTSVDDRFKEKEKHTERWEMSIESAIKELLSSQRELNIAMTKQQQIALRIEDNGMKQIDALKQQCADMQATTLRLVDRTAKAESEIKVINALVQERNENNKTFKSDTDGKIDRVLSYLTPISVVSIAIGLFLKDFMG